MNKNIKIVFVSDMHLGHKKVPSLLTYESFKEQAYGDIREADLFISGGDMFDQSLKLDNEASFIALNLAEDLRDIAKTHNTRLRFLRGTFTHDRHQNQLFTNVCKDTDMKYVDTITIEVIKDLGISILYIPDNLPYKSSSEAILYIKELMNIHQLDKVDLVIGHGYFEHVLPKNVPLSHICYFTYTDFEDITDGPVLMGHVHTHSVYKNIIYNGSYNRLAHGEEEDKGYSLVELSEDNYHYKFIPNNAPVVHITIALKGNEIDKLVCDISELIEELFINGELGYIRLKSADSELRKNISSILSSKYPNIQFTHISTVEKEVITDIDTFCVHEFIQPNKLNISELIFSFIQERKPTEVSAITIEDISNILEL